MYVAFRFSFNVNNNSELLYNASFSSYRLLVIPRAFLHEKPKWEERIEFYGRNVQDVALLFAKTSLENPFNLGTSKRSKLFISVAHFCQVLTQVGMLEIGK